MNITMTLEGDSTERLVQTVCAVIGGAQSGAAAPAQPAPYSETDRQKDKFLCQDALSMEKYVSGAYNTSIFEFTDENVRNALNHIQKEEQEHGEQLYHFMAVNNMYQQS